MSEQTAATAEWQVMGGTFTIPDGWLVTSVNCDIPKPSAIIYNEDTDEEREVFIPKSLAYYLGVHHCGSYAMREVIQNSSIRELQDKIKVLLGL